MDDKQNNPLIDKTIDLEMQSLEIQLNNQDTNISDKSSNKEINVLDNNQEMKINVSDKRSSQEMLISDKRSSQKTNVSDKIIKNLVFSGGNIQGICYVGCLKYLHETNKLNNIKNISCSSVGSIIGLMLTLKLSIKHIEEFVINLDFSKLKSIDWDLIITDFGLDKGDKLTTFLNEVIENITGIKD